MNSCEDLHAGHCKSANSITVTGASGFPSGTRDDSGERPVVSTEQAASENERKSEAVMSEWRMREEMKG